MPSSLDAFSQGCLLDAYKDPPKTSAAVSAGIDAVPPGHLFEALEKLMSFNTLLDRLLVDFPPQLGSQNPPK